jgi:hypothetical protein
VKGVDETPFGSWLDAYGRAWERSLREWWLRRELD